jgi:hypothetical protein
MRGAIGPIGDDIPSIFPIVAGVLLFMSTALYASNQLSERNSYLELSKAGIGLSYVVLSSPYMRDDFFKGECTQTYRDYAARRRVDFLITVKKFCHYTDLNGDIFSVKNPYPPHLSLDTGVYAGDGGYHHLGLACGSDSTNWNAAQAPCAGGVCNLLLTGKQPKNFQSFNFPIAVDCGKQEPFVGVGTLNIIVWRGG